MEPESIVHRLIKKIRSMHPCHFLWITVVLSQMFTVIANTIQSYLWWGFLSKDLLRIGAIDALFVPVLVAPFVLYFLWESKQLEKELSKSKRMLEDITQGIDEGIMLLSHDFRILWANKATSRLTGLSMQELIGNFCFKATHHREAPCDSPDDLCPAAELFKTGSSNVMEHTHYDKNGKRIDVEVSVYPIRNDSGESVSFVHMTRDITERKHLESEKNRLIKEGEKLKIFNATVMSTQHILNNLLNHMQLILLEIEKTNTLDNKTKELLEESLEHAAKQVKSLSSVSEINEESIKNSVYPK